MTFDSAKQWVSDRAPLLRDAEGRDESETSAHWNAHSLHFTDSEGNILDFIVRRDIVDHRTDSFGAAHIQCISEVGSAVDDVPDVAAQVESMFDVDTCGSGAPSPWPALVPDRHAEQHRRPDRHHRQRRRGTAGQQPWNHNPLDP